MDNIAIFTLKGKGESVKKEVMQLFKSKDLHKFNQFLRLKITCDQNNMTITISQEKYIQKIIEQAGLSDTNLVQLPLKAKTNSNDMKANRLTFFMQQESANLYMQLLAHIQTLHSPCNIYCNSQTIQDQNTLQQSKTCTTISKE